LARALRLHALCGREWGRSDAPPQVPRNRRAAATLAATGFRLGGAGSGGSRGVPWRLQPWRPRSEHPGVGTSDGSGGSGRGLGAALRFLADVASERTRARPATTPS
jgi:hypothetical protein